MYELKSSDYSELYIIKTNQLTDVKDNHENIRIFIFSHLSPFSTLSFFSIFSQRDFWLLWAKNKNISFENFQ